MKYAAEMGLGAMMYIPSLIKICSAVQKVKGRIRMHCMTPSVGPCKNPCLPYQCSFSPPKVICVPCTFGYFLRTIVGSLFAIPAIGSKHVAKFCFVSTIFDQFCLILRSTAATVYMSNGMTTDEQ